MLRRHKNCCVIYLSQSYYKTPKDIRLNCSHYIIFESPTKRENEAMNPGAEFKILRFALL